MTLNVRVSRQLICSLALTRTHTHTQATTSQCAAANTAAKQHSSAAQRDDRARTHTCNWRGKDATTSNTTSLHNFYKF